MKSKSIQRTYVSAGLAALLVTVAVAGADRFTVVAANGIAFSEFRGYDTWQPVAPSQTDDGLKIIVANPVMINAYKEGIPSNGKPVPDGSMIPKIEWTGKKNPESPYSVLVPDTLKTGWTHGEGFQEIPGHRRMGICAVRVQCGVRYLHTGRKRQFIWKETLPSVPYAREGKRLRLHGVSDEMNRRARIGTPHKELTRTGASSIARLAVRAGVQRSEPVRSPNIDVARQERTGAEHPGTLSIQSSEMSRGSLIAAGFVDTPLSASLLGDELERTTARRRLAKEASMNSIDRSNENSTAGAPLPVAVTDLVIDLCYRKRLERI